MKDANSRWKKATKGGNEFCLNLILTKGMLIGSKRVEEGGSINESASWRKELEHRVRSQKGGLSRSFRQTMSGDDVTNNGRGKGVIVPIRNNNSYSTEEEKSIPQMFNSSALDRVQKDELRTEVGCGSIDRLA